MTQDLTITDEHKDAYALAILKTPSDSLGAALKVVGADNLGMALDLVKECTQDASFADRQRGLIAETGAAGYIPSKDQVVVEILQIAREPAQLADLRLRAYRLASEIAGYMPEKGGGVSVQINNRLSNRVMVVPEFASAEDWEAIATKQQAELISAATADS